jgi:hypothetical protein
MAEMTWDDVAKGLLERASGDQQLVDEAIAALRTTKLRPDFVYAELLRVAEAQR